MKCDSCQAEVEGKLFNEYPEVHEMTAFEVNDDSDDSRWNGMVSLTFQFSKEWVKKNKPTILSRWRIIPEGNV